MDMQAQSVTGIILDIDSHMKQSGITNANWYVGISSDIDERLFGFHQVPRKDHWYIYRRASNDSNARDVESAYHRAGCKGAGGGGDRTAVFVYAYVISANTVE